MEYILISDIGATNTRIAIAKITNKISLIETFVFETKKIKSIENAVQLVIDDAKKRKIKIKDAVIAIAGPINNNKAKLTNANWQVETLKLIRQTDIKKVFLLNDFEAAGYGVNTLEKKGIIKINRGKATSATSSIIGAGTGFGKAILIRTNNYFTPLPSEGGHAGFPLAANELKRLKKRFIIQDDLLSGRGYKLLEKAYKKNAANQFFKFYARAAKNFVLENLSVGGIYLTSGIIQARYKQLKKTEFIKEFTNSKKMKHILKQTPVTIIIDKDSALKGAAFYYKMRCMR